MATQWALDNDSTLGHLGSEPRLGGGETAPDLPEPLHWDERVPLGEPIPLPDSVLQEPLFATEEVNGGSEESIDGPSPSYPQAAVTPPERVRFAAPIEIRREGGDRVYAGAVVNLSVRGIACLAPADIARGEHLFATFRVNLGDKPLTLSCEVIWKRPPEHDHWVYGLRFLRLTRKEADHLREAVRERTEGRAGAWPLPLMPIAADGGCVPGRAGSPWLTAAAGMAAGIGLALCLSVIPTAGIGGPMPIGPARVVAAAVPDPAVPDPVVSTSAAPAPRVPVAVATKAPAGDPAPTPPAIPVAAAIPQPSAVIAAGLLPRRGLAAPRVDDVLHPLGGRDTLPLALLTDGPVDQHIAFWLEDPKRLVIDVMGRHSGFTKHVYTIDHPLATKLRVGDHPGKVRFVIEASDDVMPEVETQPRDGSLFVELRRKTG